jgi:hypothetical protein
MLTPPKVFKISYYYVVQAVRPCNPTEFERGLKRLLLEKLRWHVAREVGGMP